MRLFFETSKKSITETLKTRKNGDVFSDLPLLGHGI